METIHKIYYQNSNDMTLVESDSVDLVVTSPPYPMIAMWDEAFSSQNPLVKEALSDGDGRGAFEQMHQVLDKVWKQCFRVIKEGGLACINIGDAVRTIYGDFGLYANHARIINFMSKLGFTPLPAIIWRKQTNAPNKFMGSGMLPAGAYVTLEHEYILIFRKGEKRSFNTYSEKTHRRNSSFFWEERNNWFSDVWFDLKGTTQKLVDKNTRKRSGAFPFELAYRLVCMYSVKDDLVLDPFLGTGTTTAAAMAMARNSVGFELDPGFSAIIEESVQSLSQTAAEAADRRIKSHLEFVRDREKRNKPLKHINIHYEFPVVTRQETEMIFDRLVSVVKNRNGYKAEHQPDLNKPES